MRQYRTRTESNSNRTPTTDTRSNICLTHHLTLPVEEEPALSQQRKTKQGCHPMGVQRIVAGIRSGVIPTIQDCHTVRRTGRSGRCLPYRGRSSR